MGNNTLNNHFDIDINTEFQQRERALNGLILQHKQNKQTFLLREYTYASEMQYEQERMRLEREITHPKSENILGVYKIKTHTITGLCSTTHKIYAIYEYPQVSLQDEIIARRKENKQFEQNELWSVLQSCNTALSLLKSSISLRPCAVFINPEGQMKVINNDMISQDYRFTVDRQYYYAPQKINNFCKLDNQITISKQAVFSMGMTLLQTALLQTKLECYDFDRMMFLEDQLSNCLQQLEGQYSADLIQILDLILNVNPNVRPSIADLQKLLDNYWDSYFQSNEKQSKNGESLNIQTYDQQKRFLMTSQQGVFKNLATITSNQKQSIIRSDVYLKNSPLAKDNKESKTQQNMGLKMEEITKHKQSVASHQKQNIYTDPTLLQMIRKDLECINQLKQSTLKQTIKYSFLYPNHSIFSSVKDLDMTSKQKRATNTHHLNLPSSNTSKPIQQSSNKIELQMSVQNSAFNAEYKITTPAEVSERSYMQSSNQHKNQRYNKSLIYCRELEGQGRYYEGYKLNGLKQGKGKLTFEDGVYYEGEFQNDQMNGRGILYYRQNKPAYDGMWVNNQFHGLGILYNENPQYLQSEFNFNDFDQVQDYWSKYQGQFYFDNKCGKGKLQLTNGDIIEGWFQNDMINGECEFRSRKGETVRGVWEQNRLVEIHQ